MFVIFINKLFLTILWFEIRMQTNLAYMVDGKKIIFKNKISIKFQITLKWKEPMENSFDNEVINDDTNNNVETGKFCEF